VVKFSAAAARRDRLRPLVRGQAVHFFCQLVATGKVWKLVGIAEAYMRRTHARAGAVGGSEFHLSTHPCHLLSTLLHEGAHILEAHMPGRTCLGAHMPGARPDTNRYKPQAGIQLVVCTYRQ
jgi:hypothetical protein